MQIVEITPEERSELENLYLGANIKLNEPYSIVTKNAVGEVIRIDDEGDFVVRFDRQYIDPAKARLDADPRPTVTLSVPRTMFMSYL